MRIGLETKLEAELESKGGKAGGACEKGPPEPGGGQRSPEADSRLSWAHGTALAGPRLLP